MKTILASIDFSSVTHQVIAEAAILAKAVSARLVVLHVVQPTVITGSEVWADMKNEFDALTVKSAAKQLADLQRRLKLEGVMIETKHVIGVPGRCIPEQAVELNADYIVLGSHGHGAFYDLVIGGTASRVLKEAHCPVVVVPHATLTKKAPRIRPRPSARARLSVVR